MKFSKYILLLAALLMFAINWEPAQAAFLNNQPSLQASPEAVQAEITIETLGSKINELTERIGQFETQETEQTAAHLGVTIDQLKERTANVRNMLALYQRQLTAIKKRDSLKQQEKILKSKYESQKVTDILQSPPYSLSFYDSALDKLDAAIQQEETALLTLNLAKKSLEESRTRFDSAQQSLRAIIEEADKGKNNAVSSVGAWNVGQAKIEVDVSQTQYQLFKINHENALTELSIVRLGKDMALRDVEWIKAHLAFDPEDLQKKLDTLSELRKKFQDRTNTLLREQNRAENAWLQAQKDLNGKRESSETASAQAEAFLNERESWRETYQKVLEQTEYVLQLVGQEEQTWQRRYAMIKEAQDYTKVQEWQKEARVNLTSVERLLTLQQNQRTNLYSQIATLQKQLAENTLDRSVRQSVENQLKAKERLSERGLEYLAMLQGAQRLTQRFLEETALERERVTLTTRLAAALAKIRGIWEFELWVIDDKSVSVKKVFTALLILIIGIILVKNFIRLFSKRLLPRTKLDENAKSAVEKVIFYFALLFIVLFAMRTVNIPLTAFAFLGGAIAIGIGFGAQNLINNFISGFIIMMERPIRIGDVIEVENNFGTIENIGARCTQLRTFDNVRVLVPNSSFLEKNIINWTMIEQSVRSKVTVGVAYGSDTRKVEKLMLQAAREHPNVLKSPEPFVLFWEFGDNSLVFEVFFWVWIMKRWTTQSDIRFRIDELFRQAGVVIAFPQRDTHLDTLKPLDVRLIRPEDEPPGNE